MLGDVGLEVKLTYLEDMLWNPNAPQLQNNHQYTQEITAQEQLWKS